MHICTKVMLFFHSWTGKKNWDSQSNKLMSLYHTSFHLHFSLLFHQALTPYPFLESLPYLVLTQVKFQNIGTVNNKIILHLCPHTNLLVVDWDYAYQWTFWHRTNRGYLPWTFLQRWPLGPLLRNFQSSLFRSHPLLWWPSAPPYE